MQRRHVFWLISGFVALVAICLAVQLAARGFADVVQSVRHPLRHVIAQKDFLIELSVQHPVFAAVGYVGVYVVLTGLTLPVNVPLSIAGGAMFGLTEGVALTSVATATGATLSCLTSRTLLRDLVRRRIGNRLEEVEAGLAREGGVYLLGLRLMPAIPYVVVNMLFGLTTMRLRVFFALTWLGTLPVTTALVSAGTSLNNLDSGQPLFGTNFLVSVTLIACALLVTALVRQVFLRRSR